MSIAQYLKDRAGRKNEMLTALATIELSAGDNHKGYGATIDVEVTFTQTPVVKCSPFCHPDDAFPDEGGEREFVSLEVIDENGKAMDAPKWLLDALADSIDVDALEAKDD